MIPKFINGKRFSRVTREFISFSFNQGKSSSRNTCLRQVSYCVAFVPRFQSQSNSEFDSFSCFHRFNGNYFATGKITQIIRRIKLFCHCLVLVSCWFIGFWFLRRSTVILFKHLDLITWWIVLISSTSFLSIYWNTNYLSLMVCHVEVEYQPKK